MKSKKVDTGCIHSQCRHQAKMPPRKLTQDADLMGVKHYSFVTSNHFKSFPLTVKHSPAVRSLRCVSLKCSWMCSFVNLKTLSSPPVWVLSKLFPSGSAVVYVKLLFFCALKASALPTMHSNAPTQPPTAYGRPLQMNLLLMARGGCWMMFSKAWERSVSSQPDVTTVESLRFTPLAFWHCNKTCCHVWRQ